MLHILAADQIMQSIQLLLQRCEDYMCYYNSFMRKGLHPHKSQAQTCNNIILETGPFLLAPALAAMVSWVPWAGRKSRNGKKPFSMSKQPKESLHSVVVLGRSFSVKCIWEIPGKITLSPPQKRTLTCRQCLISSLMETALVI